MSYFGVADWAVLAEESVLVDASRAKDVAALGFSSHADVMLANSAGDAKVVWYFLSLGGLEEVDGW